MNTLVLQADKGTNGEADMVALGTRGAHLRSFDITRLLEPQMMRFDAPNLTRQFQTPPYNGERIWTRAVRKTGVFAPSQPQLSLI